MANIAGIKAYLCRDIAVHKSLQSTHDFYTTKPNK